MIIFQSFKSIRKFPLALREYGFGGLQKVLDQIPTREYYS